MKAVTVLRSSAEYVCLLDLDLLIYSGNPLLRLIQTINTYILVDIKQQLST